MIIEHIMIKQHSQFIHCSVSFSVFSCFLCLFNLFVSSCLDFICAKCLVLQTGFFCFKPFSLFF